MTYLLIGDSHCAAIVTAAADAKGPRIVGDKLRAATAFYRPFLDTSARDIRFTDPVMTQSLGLLLSEAGAEKIEDFRDAVIVSLGLCSIPIVSNLARAKCDFNPGYADASRHFLSEAIVDRLVATATRHIIEFYERLATAGLLKAAVDGPAWQADHPYAAFFGERLDTISERFETPVREALVRLGCRIISAGEARGADGFLKPEYRGHDTSHGNAAFGALLLAQLS